MDTFKVLHSSYFMYTPGLFKDPQIKIIPWISQYTVAATLGILSPFNIQFTMNVIVHVLPV